MSRTILKGLITFFLCVGAFLTAEEVGSLLVTFQTGMKGERLDRIRFRIKNTEWEQQIYPKPGGYVDDIKSHIRVVAIEKIPVGTYMVEFLIPNKDGLFDEIPLREIVITENKTFKIDQQIRPRYASLKVKVDYQPTSALENPPQITLFNENKILLSSSPGHLEIPSILPGTYIITFDQLEGYKTPSPITVQLKPKEEVGPLVGIYISNDN